MWDAQWPVFAGAFRAIRYDLRGFGSSSLPAKPYSHVADFLALTQLLGAQPAHLVGLSNGGRLALRIALEAPAAVRTLTLADSALDGYRWGEAYAQSWRRMNASGRTDVAAAKRQWLEHELFAPARANPKAAGALAAMVGRYSGWHFHHSDPEIGAQRIVMDELSSIRAPTLILVGERDLPDFHAVARLVAGKLPDASLKVIARVGHLSNLEDAETFNQLLLTHLNQPADRVRP